MGNGKGGMGGQGRQGDKGDKGTRGNFFPNDAAMRDCRQSLSNALTPQCPITNYQLPRYHVPNYPLIDRLVIRL